MSEPYKLPDELKEMIDKLPNTENQELAELDYKLLYCVKNNDKNSDEVKSAYNYLIEKNDNIHENKIENVVEKTSYNNTNTTFDEGFIVNTKPIAKKGGSHPTQKRRPKRQRKSSHTIKDRVKTR